ncbi:hypothetical protein CVT24_013059 [Panaeolus cyanescens]|uniref:Protein kinase domain-containing protein n=1 Tax=Panaeolus cyanescens TaxID=181874 RepID=A0A409YUS5_9AGAR|nr:hypothetical protein CVT24_013059 [Panaeolus cyanescens]
MAASGDFALSGYSLSPPFDTNFLVSSSYKGLEVQTPLIPLPHQQQMVNLSDFHFLPDPTTPSWSIGPLRYHSLDFSCDGKTLSSSTQGDEDIGVVCWNTRTGERVGNFPGYREMVFSPTDPQVAVMQGHQPGFAKVTQTSATGVQSWTIANVHEFTTRHCVRPAFRHDGVMASYFHGSLNETRVNESIHYARNWKYPGPYPAPLTFIYSPSELDTIFLCTSTAQHTLRYHRESYGEGVMLNSTMEPNCTGITTSAWSRNGMWIATGDSADKVLLWDARNTSGINRLKTLPRDRTEAIMTVVFTHDCSLLFIVNAGHYIDVYDIEKGDYVTNSGLPDRGKNIAVDGPRDIVAVATMDDKITLYNLQPRHNTSQNPSIPALLSAHDITSAVVRPKSVPFPGLYFDIYRGAWKLSSPCSFHHAVAIKVLRPGFNPRSKKQERQDFKNLLTKCLVRWISPDLIHDNLVPLLGVYGDFGEFPALITSWMMNGLLSEYLQSEEEYEEKGLMMDVANGVAHLHSHYIVHSDIRASSILIDELGHARLSDPGLFRIFAKSPLVANGTVNQPYRWTAPELLSSSSKEPDLKTDVFSFTMTCLEIYTGAQPFDGVGEALIPGKILQNERPSKPDNVSDSLWAIWGKGWDTDPSKRPDMEEYVKSLQDLPQ